MISPGLLKEPGLLADMLSHGLERFEGTGPAFASSVGRMMALLMPANGICILASGVSRISNLLRQ
jgi:hypothetical protein